MMAANPASGAAVIEARGLRKHYGNTPALAGLDLRVEAGSIVGLLGPNGAGKTTAIHALLGLIPYEGELRVLGYDPWRQREALMREACYIADVAVLPRWARAGQLLDYFAGVHPRFDRARALHLLGATSIALGQRVSELSKGMVTQLHLALVLAVDAPLLVLDEPTLGLDLLFRKQFYDSLLADYCDKPRTILLTTHQVDEVQHVLTEAILLHRGRAILHSSMEGLDSRFAELTVRADQLAAARALHPLHERPLFGQTVLLFDGVDRQQLAPLGEVRTPSLSDLFVAVLSAASAGGGTR